MAKVVNRAAGTQDQAQRHGERWRYAFAASLVLCGLMGGHVLIDSGSSTPGESGLAVLLRGQDWPVLSHLMVALPTFVAAALILLSRRAIAVPNPKVSIWLAILGGLGWASILPSDYRSLSLFGAVEWSAYVVVFFAVVAGGGRAHGGTLLGAIGGGGALSALLAIRQYGEMKAADPGFRVMGPWNNPNAIGAYLAIALIALVACGLTLKRPLNLAAYGAATIVGFALALTQSKGAWLAVGVGLGIFLLVLALTRSKTFVKGGVSVFAVLAIAAVLTLGASRSVSSPGAASSGVGSPLARISNTGEAATQSVGFRRLLWQSAIELGRGEPAGGGLNSFGPRSTIPGRITQTQLAHSTPLQLFSEVSAVGAAAFVVFALAVGVIAIRGATSLSTERKIILAGAVGAFTCALLHNLIDSDAYYFGLGFTLFALAGIILLAACDTSAPELVPSGWRYAGVALLSILAGFWAYLGWIDSQTAAARGLAFAGDRNAEAMISQVTAAAPFDARAFSLRALVTADPDQRLSYLRRAAALGPTPKALRAVAGELYRRGDFSGAVTNLERALVLDPNNLAALTQAREASLQSRNQAEAVRYALKTVDVEAKSYFTVRSQAELIPTAIAEARVYLAGRESDPAKRSELLRRALQTYRDYARLTIPVVARFDTGAGMDVAGETREKALANLATAQTILIELKRLQPRLDLRETEADLASAAALLRRDSPSK